MGFKHISRDFTLTSSSNEVVSASKSKLVWKMVWVRKSSLEFFGWTPWSPQTPPILVASSENDFLNPKAQKQKHDTEATVKNSHLLSQNTGELGRIWEAHIS